MVLSMVSLQSVLCAASTDPRVKWVCSSGRAEETAQSWWKKQRDFYVLHQEVCIELLRNYRILMGIALATLLFLEDCAFYLGMIPKTLSSLNKLCLKWKRRTSHRIKIKLCILTSG